MTTEASAPAHNIPDYSVSELSDALRRTLEDRFARVRVRGEISGLKRAASGHIYLALKDADALLQAIIWKGAAAKLTVKPEDGMEVAAIGRLTTYPGRSSYQLVIERLELAGRGALLALIEERKKKLAAEGLFDPARKKRLPFLPEVIGVITSPTGAVIRDILHRLADRFPRPVLIWPCLVQGEGAAEQIAAAIAGFNALTPGGAIPRPDLLIVARGGGSAEDLMAFNEEIVVRAAAASAIPLISAVGHETDVTLIDFAADLRAPTPTAAAEMAAPVRAELRARTQEIGRRLAGAVDAALERLRLRLEGLGRGLPDPATQARQAAQRLDEWGERLTAAARAALAARQGYAATLGARLPHPRAQVAVARERLAAIPLDRLSGSIRRRGGDEARRLEALGRVLESCSYRGALARGFVVARDSAGRPLTQAVAARAAGALILEFADGRVDARTLDAPPSPPKSTTGPTRAPRRRPPGQGELF